MSALIFAIKHEFWCMKFWPFSLRRLMRTYRNERIRQRLGLPF